MFHFKFPEPVWKSQKYSFAVIEQKEEKYISSVFLFMWVCKGWKEFKSSCVFSQKNGWLKHAMAEKCGRTAGFLWSSAPWRSVTQVHEELSEILPFNALYHINLAAVIASLPLDLLLLPPSSYYLEILIRLGGIKYSDIRACRGCIAFVSLLTQDW